MNLINNLWHLSYRMAGVKNLFMKGYIANIEKTTRENSNFRKVLYTAKHSQLVVMNLKPGEEIGEEVHTLDQFIRVEEGEGIAVLNGKEERIKDGFAVVIPAGVTHNIINTSNEKEMKLYTIYSPPNHEDGVIHKTKEEAIADDEYFDGKTSPPSLPSGGYGRASEE